MEICICLDLALLDIALGKNIVVVVVVDTHYCCYRLRLLLASVACSIVQLDSFRSMQRLSIKRDEYGICLLFL